MIEVRGNLWTYPATVKCITTNGTIKRNGDAVMGRGCAYEAAQTWSDIPTLLGRNLKAYGNHVRELGRFALSLDAVPFYLFNFPVKHQWFDKADYDLIRRSCEELQNEVAMYVNDDVDVVLPRPGVGNGKLPWSEVKPILQDLLPEDRWKVITW